MQNNARKQRLMREALGNADGEMPAAERNYAAIAIFALILFAVTALSGFHQDDRKIVTAAVTDRYVASGRDDSPMPMKQNLAGKAQPEGQAQRQSEARGKEAEGNVQDLTY
jgi:hypothetical protein